MTVVSPALFTHLFGYFFAYNSRKVNFTYFLYKINSFCHVLYFILAPTKPPVIKFFRFVNSTSMNVTWEPPAKKYRHGDVVRYWLYLAEGVCSSNPPPSSPTPITTAITSTTSGENVKTEESSPSRKPRSVQRSCNYAKISVHGKLHSYVFVNLTKWTNYSVSIVCFTVGPSRSSSTSVNATDEDSKYQYYHHNQSFFLNFHVISYKIYHTIIHLTCRRQCIIGLSVKIHSLFD